MTSLTALLCNWPLVDQIRECADRPALTKQDKENVGS